MVLRRELIAATFPDPVSALDLVIAAVTLCNTPQFHRTVVAFCASGEIIDGALLARVAPLGWEHVAITDHYVREEAPALDGDGFQPLANISLSAEPYN